MVCFFGAFFLIQEEMNWGEEHQNNSKGKPPKQKMNKNLNSILQNAVFLIVKLLEVYG